MRWLLIDIGNTDTKYRTLDEDWQTLDGGRLVDSDWKQVVEKNGVRSAVVCASGRNADSVMMHLAELGVQTWTVSELEDLGVVGRLIAIDYETPKTLGQDRVAAVCGAWSVMQQACVVIDGGTCITVDYVDDKGCFRGGAIMPSAELQLLAMHEHTAKLPLPEIDYAAYYQPLGHSTREALLAGAICGARMAVMGMVDYYRRQNPQLQVVYTGGVGEFICGEIEGAQYVPELVFDGMKALAQELEKTNGHTHVKQTTI